MKNGIIFLGEGVHDVWNSYINWKLWYNISMNSGTILALMILFIYWCYVIIINAIRIKIGNKDKFTEKYLIQDEHVVSEGEMVFNKEIIIAIIIGIIGTIISISVKETMIVFLYAISFSLSFLIKPYVLKKTTRLIITNKRLLLTYGTWNNNVVDYSLDKISNISLKQTLLGRIFKFAKIAIVSTSGAELRLWNRDLQLKNAEGFIKAFVLMRT